MTLPETIVASLVGLAALVLVSAPEARAATPIRGAYSGITTAGAPLSFLVATKMTGPKLRAKGVKRRAQVSFVKGAVPISCSSGLGRSEEIGFPGPLGVKRNGHFDVTGVADAGVNGRVTTTMAGRFTGRRVASGRLTYRGGFFGEFCSGEITWTAARE